MLHFYGALSLAAYLLMAGLSASGTPTRIALGLAFWASTFVLYGLAARAVYRQRTDQCDVDDQDSPQPPKAVAIGAPILLWALLFRIALIPAGLPETGTVGALLADLEGKESGYQTFLLWDNDVWRYLFEGHVVGEGLSPYRISPQEIFDASDREQAWAEDLIYEGPWLDVFDRMSYREYRSVYPPLALLSFRISTALAPGSVLVWKCLLVTMEFGGCLLFFLLLQKLRLSPELGLLLAWNPLLIKEVAGSAHIDGVLPTVIIAGLLLFSSKRHSLAIACLSAAVLFKLWPLLFVPALLARTRPTSWWPLPLLLVACSWPFRFDLLHLVDSFQRFAENWVFNPGPWLLFEKLGHAAGASGRRFPDLMHISLTFAVVTALALRAYSAGRSSKGEPGTSAASSGSPVDGESQTLLESRTATVSLCRDWFWVGGVFLLFSATVMPWYLVAILPLAIVIQAWPWLVLTGVAVLSYGIFLTGQEQGWILAIEYALAAAAFAWWIRSSGLHHRWRRQGTMS